MNPFEDPVMRERYDAFFKNLMHDSRIVIPLLRDTVSDFAGMSDDEIRKTLPMEKDGIHIALSENESNNQFGRVVFDAVIRTTSEDMRKRIIIDIEGQTHYDSLGSLIPRIVYYGARNIDSQKGRVFRGDSYEDLERSRSVWVIIKPPVRDANTGFRMKLDVERIEGLRLPDAIPSFDFLDMSVIQLGLPNRDLPLSSRILDVFLGNSETFRENISEIVKEINIADDDDLLKEAVEVGELYDGLVKSLRRDLRDEVKAEVDSDYARSIAELYFPDIKSGEITIEKALTYVPPPLKDEFKRNIDRMLASSE